MYIVNMNNKIPKPKTPLPPGGRFCDRLWWLLQVNGDTAAYASRVAGVSCKTIFTYLSGKENPKVRVVIALADHYGVTTDFLLGRTREPRGYTDSL